MSRKATIVFAITTLITALVFGFSWIYLSQLLRQRLLWADETASMLTRQLEYTASKAVPDLTSTRIDTSNPKALRDAISEFLQIDTNLNDMLESVVGNSQIISDPASSRLDCLAGCRLPPSAPSALQPRHRLRCEHPAAIGGTTFRQRSRRSVDRLSAK